MILPDEDRRAYNAARARRLRAHYKAERPEKHAEILAKQRDYNRRYYERDKKDPVRLAKRRRYVRDLMRKRRAAMTPEEKNEARARDRELRREKPDYFRDRDRRRAFDERNGPELAAWVARFGARCWICKEPLDLSKKSDRDRDHCHYTGKPRGLAHKMCNVFLGHVENRPQFIEHIAKAYERCLEIKKEAGPEALPVFKKKVPVLARKRTATDPERAGR